MRMLDEITIHGSVTAPDWMAGRPLAEKVAEIRRWHLSRGFNDIGYHFVVDRDGAVAAGRAVERLGAGVAGQNTGKIHICLLGGRGGVGDDVFETHYTASQNGALRELIDDLQDDFGPLAVRGHNDHAATACPQFDVATWLSEFETARVTAPVPADPFATPRWLRHIAGWLFR
jgi:hypothetical protein